MGWRDFRFQQAFDKFKEHPVTIQLINDIKKYALKISALKIEENLIQFFKKGLLWEVCVLIYNIILAAITFIIVILLFQPICQKRNTTRLFALIVILGCGQSSAAAEIKNTRAARAEEGVFSEALAAEPLFFLLLS